MMFKGINALTSGVGVRQRFAARAALAAAVGMALAVNVASGQSFTSLGFLPPVGSESYARDVNADGSVVVGLANPGDGNYNVGFRWTEVDDTMTGLPNLPGASASTARSVKHDGSKTAGWAGFLTYSHACLWVDNGNPTDLGVLPNGTTSYAHSISDNGSVVVGFGNVDSNGHNHAFRWTGGVMTDLGTLNGGYYSYAYGVSGDGLVAVGSAQKASNFVAFRWTAGGGMENLGTLKANKPAEAWATNTNGSVVVGYSGTANAEHAFRWTGGKMTDFGALSGIPNTYALSVSGNGSAVVGFASQESGSPGGRAVPLPDTNRAFLWTTSGGLKNLNTYLPTLGINLSGWVLTEARSISTDGKIIVGCGYHDGAPEAWIAHLP